MIGSSYFQIELTQIICVESEDSSLNDEIDRVRIEIELLMTQSREDANTLALLREKILTSMKNDHEYSRGEAFFQQVKDETLIINNYIEKMKKITGLRERYGELMKKKLSK